MTKIIPDYTLSLVMVLVVCQTRAKIVVAEEDFCLSGHKLTRALLWFTQGVHSIRHFYSFSSDMYMIRTKCMCKKRQMLAGW